MELPKLKPIELRILQAIQKYYSTHGKPPAMAEVVAIANIPAGVGSVAWYCGKLTSLGLLLPREKYEARSLLLSDYGKEVLNNIILDK